MAHAKAQFDKLRNQNHEWKAKNEKLTKEIEDLKAGQQVGPSDELAELKNLLEETNSQK